MAAFQFVNYNKPGPGVSKDAPPKSRFVVFFEIFSRKFTNLIKVNLMFMIPVIIAFLMTFGVSYFTNSVFLVFLPLVLISPFVAGLTFITRNYAREEHAFVFSDFKEAVQKNWKQFLVHGIITYCFVILMYLATMFYYYNAPNNNFFYVPLAVCIMMCVLFLFMQYYIPVMIITFDLKLRQIYKNALILAIIGLGRNLLLSLILLLIFGGLLLLFMLTGSALVLMLLFLLAVLLIFSFVSLLCNYMVYPMIEKYLIKPYYEKQTEGSEEEQKALAAAADEDYDEETAQALGKTEAGKSQIRICI